MGWMSDAPGHEGWAAATFADGGLGGGWGTPHSGGPAGVMVTRIGDRPLGYSEWQYRPPADITGWRAGCDCGWLGPEHPRPAGLVPEFNDAPADLEELCRAEWEAHVKPLKGLAEVDQLATEHAEIGRRLTAAVGRARGRGSSWAEIGAATGMSRQSAHERWRHVG
jgi:hypothetical protein